MKKPFKWVIGLMTAFLFLLIACQNAEGPESKAKLIPERFKKDWRSLKPVSYTHLTLPTSDLV